LQPAFDRGPQKRTTGHIDATDHDCHALKRFRDGGRYRGVDTQPACAMSDRCRRFVSSRQVATCDDDPAGVVGREFSRDAPPDNPVASYNENSFGIHDESPRR